jgi:hypothetical protein
LGVHVYCWEWEDAARIKHQKKDQMLLDWKYWKSILQKTYLNCNHMANIGCKRPPSGPSIFGSVLWSRSPCAKQKCCTEWSHWQGQQGSSWKQMERLQNPSDLSRGSWCCSPV